MKINLIKKTSFLLSFILSLNISLGQTVVPPGFVHGTWTKAGSPYQIMGSIKIANDSNLIIEPGVVVMFQGHFKLLVEGSLIAEGLVNDSIIFSATNTTNGWYGIRFDNILSSNDSSKFKYCSIRWSKANGINNDSYGGAFFLNNFSKVKISNCLIDNSTSSGYKGGGIYCSNSSPVIGFNTISNCFGGGIYSENTSNPHIHNNMIVNNDGRGIVIDGGSTALIVEGNTISNNSRTGFDVTQSNGVQVLNNVIINNGDLNQTGPGGMRIDYSSPLIKGNEVARNEGSSYSGGIYFYFSSNSVVSDNFVHHNVSDNGGAIGCITSNISLTNNVITNNTALSNGSSFSGQGGAFYLSSSNPTILNNTIANNSAAKGGALFLTSGSSPTITNSILYGNTGIGDQVYVNDEPSDPNFTYSNVQNNSIGFAMNGHFYSGTYQNNIDTDPFFVTPSSASGYNVPQTPSEDWSLNSNSPCIDAGSPTGNYPALDRAGAIRVVNGIIDMGAFETQTPLGLNNNLDASNSLKLYPNPAISYITVETPFETVQNVQFKIFDATGKLVLEQNLEGNTNITINVGKLKQGVYLLQLFSNKNFYSKSFLKR